MGLAVNFLTVSALHHDYDLTSVMKEKAMAKDHGNSVKNDKQYEGLRKKGMSKARAARISNSPGASKRGGKNSHKGSN